MSPEKPSQANSLIDAVRDRLGVVDDGQVVVPRDGVVISDCRWDASLFNDGHFLRIREILDHDINVRIETARVANDAFHGPHTADIAGFAAAVVHGEFQKQQINRTLSEYMRSSRIAPNVESVPPIPHSENQDGYPETAPSGPHTCGRANRFAS